MGFQFNINTNAAVEAGKGGALGSGVHKVTIQEAWLGTSKNGNNVVDLELQAESGERATIYGMCLDETFTSGAKNSSYGAWNELAIVCGMQTGAVVAMERTLFGGTKETQNAFTELVGKTFVVGLQIVFDVNQDKTKEVKRRSLYRAFYANGLSVAEAQAGQTEPKNSIALASSLTDYKNKDWEALQARIAGGTVAPAGAMVPPAAVAVVAPIAPAGVVAPVAAAPVAAATPTVPVMAAPAPVAQVAPVGTAPTGQMIQPAAVQAPVPGQVTPPQPMQAAAVAQGMPVANPALAGAF